MSYEEVCELFDSTMPTNTGDSVILSNDEINRARRNKREMRKKATGFQKTLRFTDLYIAQCACSLRLFN